MGWYHFALAGLAFLALILSWNVPRCGKWIFLLSASYIVSVVYYRMIQYGDVMPHGAVVAFFCDAAVFVVIRQMHVERWEIWGLGSIALLMASFNMVQVSAVSFGFPPVMDQTLYSAILECANAAYLLLIGGIGLADWFTNGRGERHNLGWHRAAGVASNLSTITEEARKKSHVRKLSL